MDFIKKYYGFIIGALVFLIYLVSFKYSISDKPAEALEQFNLVNIHIGLSKYLIYALLLLCLGFFVYGIKQNPKSGVKFGLGFGALAVLFFICYAMAGNDPAELGMQDMIDAGKYKLVGGMIYTTMVLMFAGAGVLIGLSIKNMISNAKA